MVGGGGGEPMSDSHQLKKALNKIWTKLKFFNDFKDNRRGKMAVVFHGWTWSTFRALAPMKFVGSKFWKKSLVSKKSPTTFIFEDLLYHSYCSLTKLPPTCKNAFSVVYYFKIAMYRVDRRGRRPRRGRHGKRAALSPKYT